MSDFPESIFVTGSELWKPTYTRSTYLPSKTIHWSFSADPDFYEHELGKERTSQISFEIVARSIYRDTSDYLLVSRLVEIHTTPNVICDIVCLTWEA